VTRALLTLCFALSAGATVLAQGSAAQPAVEIGGGGALALPRSLGTSRADLARGDGSALTLFRVERRSTFGPGAEALIGVRVAPRLLAEVAGSWLWPQLETRVFDDSEGADDVTVTGRLSRVSLEGAAVWHVVEGTRGALFARGGGGWVRELAGTSGLAEDGVSGTIGAGVKYWGRRSSGAPGRVGVRAEIRANLRSAGLAPGSTGITVTPVVYAGAFMRF
jgi:hypothetical protein